MAYRALRILTFRASADDYAALDVRYLTVGLVATWIVGIGRYWDNPRVEPLQRAGVGSVVYVFVLAALLFVLGLGLRLPRWSYRHLLTFVTLTAFPGLIYAIPVERFLAPEAARATNLWFLAVVAAWRLALYGTYLRRYVALPLGRFLVMLLLPLTAIVVALTALNLERAVFDLMSGVDRETTSADSAFAALWALTAISMLLAPVLGLGYVVLAVSAWRKARQERRQTA